MFNCYDQIHWATEYPDIWLNVILAMSVRMSLDKINIDIDILSKVLCFHNVGGPCAIS